MEEITTLTNNEKEIAVTPYIYPTDFGTYLITTHCIAETTTLFGEHVCSFCEKDPIDENYTLGDYGECNNPKKYFCSKKCLMEYLKEER